MDTEMRGRVLAIGLAGSRLYGLENENSDKDFIVITESKILKDKQTIKDDMDVRHTSLHNFAMRISTSTPQEVDLLRSRHLTIVPEFQPYFNSLRFDPAQYIKRISAHIRSDLRNSHRDRYDNLRRSKKSLKTAMRNFHLRKRVIEGGNEFSSWFDTDQRNTLFSDVKRIHEMLYTIYSFDDLEDFLDTFD